MNDRSAAIKALERAWNYLDVQNRTFKAVVLKCNGVYDGETVFDETLDGIKDALALLKAQEPHVMTLEEVKQKHICWIEDADDGMEVRLFPGTMFGIGEYANGSKSYMFLAQKPWAIDANDCEWWYLIEDYGETWRCWTSRPDKATREATPWD